MREKWPIYPDHVCTEWWRIYYRETAKLIVDVAYRSLIADTSFWCICFGAIASAINMRTAFINLLLQHARARAATTTIKPFIGSMHTEFRCEFHNFISHFNCGTLFALIKCLWPLVRLHSTVTAVPWAHTEQPVRERPNNQTNNGLCYSLPRKIDNKMFSPISTAPVRYSFTHFWLLPRGPQGA